MSFGVLTTSATAMQRARRAPRALLLLWAGQLCFAAVGFLAFRFTLGVTWAHRPAPGLLELASIATVQSSVLLPPLLAAGLLLVLYGLVSPLLYAAAVRKLSHAQRTEQLTLGRVAPSLLRLASLFTLARAAVGAIWILSWPQIDALSQHLVDERWQLVLLGAFGATGVLLWSWLSLLLRHATGALALGLAHDVRAALRIVARAQHHATATMWSCWTLERLVWLATLAMGFALHLPIAPLGWGIALLLELLVVSRLAARLWGLAAAVEVLLTTSREIARPAS